MTINIISQQRAEQRAGKLCCTGWEPAAARLREEASLAALRSIPEISFMPLNNPSRYGFGLQKGECTWTKGLIWCGHICMAVSSSLMPEWCTENGLTSASKAVLQNPELNYKSSSNSHSLCSYSSFSTVRERWIWKLLFPWGEGGNKQKRKREN